MFMAKRPQQDLMMGQLRLDAWLPQGKYLENEFFFQVREKSGNFVDGQGNL